MVQFNRYDAQGHLLEAQRPDDLVYSYLWGYGNSKRIAKIENARYEEVATALGANLAYLNNTLSPSDQTIGSKINALRSNLPQALVTGYTYEDLVGLTSSTNPNNFSSYYEYDCWDRLKRVKDDDKTILEEYKRSDYQLVIIADDCQSRTAAFQAKSYSASCQDENMTVQYTWNFGDGRTATGEHVNHSYSADGKYTVTLTATFPNNVIKTTTLFDSDCAYYYTRNISTS